LPLQGMQLQGMYERRAFSKKINFSAMAGNPELYVKSISGIEAVDLLTVKQLRKLAITLARKHGLLTWARVWWFYRRRASAQKANRTFTDREFVEPLHSKLSAQDPADETGTSSS